MVQVKTLVALISVFTGFPRVKTDSTEYVPVYLWTNSRIPEIVSEQEFTKNIKKFVSSDSVVVIFAEETLSPEDFMFRDEFGKLIFESTSSITAARTNYWPLVRSPIAEVTRLLGKSVVKTSVEELLNDSDLFNNDDSLIIVNLSDAEDNEDRLQMLKRHDKNIAEIYSKYAGTNKNVVALLTSYHSSWILSNASNSSRRRRQTNNVPEVKDDNVESKTFKNKELLIYVSSGAGLHLKDHNISLSDFKLEPENKIDADGLNATLVSEVVTNIKLKFNFQFTTGYWFLASTFVENSSGESYRLSAKNVYAPEGFSYHCHAQVFYNGSNTDVYLNLPGFQVQLFNSTSTEVQKFGDAYDCVGFTSAPIWSGLFVTFIMALIMTFGLSMMMDIKTMDRFDDPKGKTITINASE